MQFNPDVPKFVSAQGNVEISKDLNIKEKTTSTSYTTAIKLKDQHGISYKLLVTNTYDGPGHKAVKKETVQMDMNQAVNKTFKLITKNYSGADFNEKFISMHHSLKGDIKGSILKGKHSISVLGIGQKILTTITALYNSARSSLFSRDHVKLEEAIHVKFNKDTILTKNDLPKGNIEKNVLKELPPSKQQYEASLKSKMGDEVQKQTSEANSFKFLLKNKVEPDDTADSLAERQESTIKEREQEIKKLGEEIQSNKVPASNLERSKNKLASLEQSLISEKADLDTYQGLKNEFENHKQIPGNENDSFKGFLEKKVKGLQNKLEAWDEQPTVMGRTINFSKKINYIRNNQQAVLFEKLQNKIIEKFANTPLKDESGKPVIDQNKIVQYPKVGLENLTKAQREEVAAEIREEMKVVIDESRKTQETIHSELDSFMHWVDYAEAKVNEIVLDAVKQGRGEEKGIPNTIQQLKSADTKNRIEDVKDEIKLGVMSMYELIAKENKEAFMDSNEIENLASGSVAIPEKIQDLITNIETMVDTALSDVQKDIDKIASRAEGRKDRKLTLDESSWKSAVQSSMNFILYDNYTAPVALPNYLENFTDNFLDQWVKDAS